MFKLNSKIEIAVLEYFFVNPQARKYINELAQILGINPANLDKKLKELEKEGILHSEVSGKQKYYFLNKKYFLLSEVKKIFEAKYGLPEKFKKALNGLVGLEEAYLFGSFAKGNAGEESDIDLLLIGGHSSLEADRRIAKMQNQLQREINTVDIATDEFKKRKKNRDEFLENIFADKIIKII